MEIRHEMKHYLCIKGVPEEDKQEKVQMIYLKNYSRELPSCEEGNRHPSPRGTENSLQNQQKQVNSTTYHSETGKIQR